MKTSKMTTPLYPITLDVKGDLSAVSDLSIRTRNTYLDCGSPMHYIMEDFSSLKFDITKDHNVSVYSEFQLPTGKKIKEMSVADGLKVSSSELAFGLKFIFTDGTEKTSNISVSGAIEGYSPTLTVEVEEASDEF